MFVTLFIFGWIKTSVSLGDDCGLNKKFIEGTQMVIIGSVAAGAAWTLVYFIDNWWKSKKKKEKEDKDWKYSQSKYESQA